MALHGVVAVYVFGQLLAPSQLVNSREYRQLIRVLHVAEFFNFPLKAPRSGCSKSRRKSFLAMNVS
jgi:hypothetical protein